MTLFEFDERLAPVRTGRFADVATSVAWLLGLVATTAHPLGLVVAGALLALVATSVERAIAAGAAFGITVVAGGWLWLTLLGSLPIAPGVPLTFVAFLALIVPPFVAAAVRSLG